MSRDSATKKQLGILIPLYKSAAARARRVFLVSNIVSVLLLVAYFNHRWTWLRNLVRETPSTVVRPDEYMVFYGSSDDQRIDGLYELAKTSQTDFRFADFGLIGAKIFVDDLPILGGAATTIIMTWYYFARRRERNIMKAIRRLAGRLRGASLESVVYKTSLGLMFNTVVGFESAPRGVGRIAAFGVRSLIFGPCIVIFLIIGHDFYETFVTPHLRVDLQPPITLFAYMHSAGLERQAREAILRVVVAVLFLSLSFALSQKVNRLSREDAAFRRSLEQRAFDAGVVALTGEVRRDARGHGAG